MNLELGGKTPMVVFDDADLDSVVPLLAAGITTFSGQFCMTGSRILVQRGVADAVRSRLGELLENVRVGDGMDPNTDMGPLIDKPNVARVNGMVEAALAYAKPIVRGGPPDDPALAAGAFYRPTLLEVEDVTSDIVQKEVFGPVATFEVFDTEDDAIVRANAGEMGLAAGVFTNDLNISNRVSRGIKAGTVWTNTWAAINDGFAEGGYKQAASGVSAGRSRSPNSKKPRRSSTPFRPSRADRSPVPRVTTRAAMRREPGKDQAMATPIEVVGEWLQNLLDPDVVNRLVAPDATYVSLNTDNPELKKIMPWTGTSTGPQAFLDNLGTMFTRWENQAFNVTAMFGSDENVAVFGDFRYKSHSLGKVVTSPFSIFMKVVDGQVTFLQFQEDTYATASSFRKDGSWTIQTEPDAAPFPV